MAPRTDVFQYQARTQPVFTGGETITEDKYHQPWSLPVWRRIDPRHAVALAASGLFFVAPTVGETISVDKWFAALSEPIVKIKVGLRAAGQLAYAAPAPNPLVSFGWWATLSEPIVKTRPLLLTSAQQFFIPSAQPVVPFSWFGWLSELVDKHLPGLRAAQQQVLAWPPRLLPTPNITGTLNAIETKDAFLGGGIIFNRPISALSGVIELSFSPQLSVIENSAGSGIVGTIEQALSPSPGTAVATVATALVSIREV